MTISSRCRAHLFCVAALSLVATLSVGCGGNAADQAAEEHSDLPKEPVPCEAVAVELRTLRPALDLVATIVAIPERTAIISPQIGGWVEKVAVVDGQRVKAGDTLLQFDARTAENGVTHARAIVAEKQAALDRLKRGALPQELEAARQDRDKQSATVEGLRSELAALEDLVKRREFSQVHYETKVKGLKSAEAALASVNAHLKLLEEGTRKELVDEAQALLDGAHADLEHAQLALELCTIKSPIDGVVVQLVAHQGQFFDRAVSMATVIDLSEVFVQLRIPSSELGKVQIDSPVDVQLASYPDLKLSGSVKRINGEADLLTGNVTMFAAVTNDGGSLRPGLSCQAHVWLPEIPNALGVPLAAIADRSGTPVVTVIQNGTAHEVEVELGAQTQEFIQVTKGVAAGDLVATAGGYGLPDGCPVEIVKNLAAAHAANH